MAIELDFLLPVFIIAALLLFFLLNRKYKFLLVWIETIKRFAPLWLIFFPAFITYFFVCGSFSALTVVIYTAVIGKANFNATEFLLIEKSVEYLCSFIMPIIYFRILEKNNFPNFWPSIITAVHMLVAGYRDAKFIKKEPTPGKESLFESGPQILQNIELIDALIPLISLMCFYLIFYNKKPKNILFNTGSTKI